MVTSVYINDNTKSPLNYISKLKQFNTGMEYIFKPGVNIIVGENGSGKSTLLNLIKRYLMVGYTECEKGLYNSNITKIIHGIDNEVYSGIDVYADYTKNTFKFCHPGEMDGEEALSRGFQSFGEMFEQNHSSTGQAINIALYSLFNYMFSEKAKLTFDYTKEYEERHPNYVKYCDEHRVECADEFTIIMDEPDRNLSIKKIEELKSIFSHHKEHTQIIAVIHNPLLIYYLAKHTDVNFIEMTEDYVNKVINFVDNMTL